MDSINRIQIVFDLYKDYLQTDLLIVKQGYQRDCLPKS